MIHLNTIRTRLFQNPFNFCKELRLICFIFKEPRQVLSICFLFLFEKYQVKNIPRIDQSDGSKNNKSESPRVSKRMLEGLQILYPLPSIHKLFCSRTRIETEQTRKRERGVTCQIHEKF